MKFRILNKNTALKTEEVRVDNAIERSRFVVATVIVASYFATAALSTNVVGDFFRYIAGISALFASLYIIFTGATIKYQEPRILYQYLDVNEKLRTKMYDLSLDIFAFGFLYFIGIIIASIFTQALQLTLSPIYFYLLQILFMLITGVIIMVFNLPNDQPKKGGEE